MKHYLVWKEDVCEDGDIVAVEDDVELTEEVLDGFVKKWLRSFDHNEDKVSLHIVQIKFFGDISEVKATKSIRYKIGVVPICFSEEQLHRK